MGKLNEEGSVTDQIFDRSVEAPVPGALVIFHGGAPMLRAVEIPPDGLVFGRHLFGADCADELLAQRHVRVSATNGRFDITEVERLASTFIDTAAIDGDRLGLVPPLVLRAGRTVCVLLPDIRRFVGAEVKIFDHGYGEVIAGPTLAREWAKVMRAGQSEKAMFLTGEMGTGKELAARAFHRASRARGNFVSVACRDMPASVADRLLFGYDDKPGSFEAANGGTLFLDEISDIQLPLHAKILAAFESGQVTPVGSTTPRPVEVRLIIGSARFIPFELADWKFDRQLHARVSRVHVELPPLRYRFDDLAYLVAAEMKRSAPKLGMRASLIETCLVGEWTSNVRQLLGSVRYVAKEAVLKGEPAVRGSLATIGRRSKHAMGGPRPRPLCMDRDYQTRLSEAELAVELAANAERAAAERAARERAQEADLSLN